ncbi:MAG: T9SS type A sorting domain-containing protein [Saprospiraceae bacterium]|nr:T9SS type A sorting domain-containing protein [Saprospiraceae bacterium]
MRGKLFFLFAIQFWIASAQVLDTKDIQFYVEGKLLNYPLTGGVNNAQVSMADLNLDGFDDLFIFDRQGNVVLPLIFNNLINRYEYKAEFKKYFPPLYDWVILKDYNQDGVTDIFASSSTSQGPDGIEVYRGVRKNQHVEFELATNGKGNTYLKWPVGSAETQIYSSRIDIPTFDDVDQDGDMDIITFGNGAIHAEWYKNVAIERGWVKDSLIYIQESACYGGFREGGFSGDIFLANSPGECNNLLGGTSRHAGSTLLSTDLNMDGLSDLLVGDISSNRLVGLLNGGNLKVPWMKDQDPQWNSMSESVNVTVFPASFEIDYNQDQITDVVVAPNALYSSINVNNLHLYEGKLNNGLKDYHLVAKNFLVDNMLDFGSGTHPCFVDYNQDGLMDLIVGTEGEFFTNNTRAGSLVLFVNKGTSQLPEFHLLDSNYLDFKRFSLSASQVTNFTPTFGDLDADGDLDMLCGESNGRLFYCENIAGANKTFAFKNPVYGYQNIDVFGYSVPCLIDLNRDGLIDILCGSRLSNNDSNFDLCSSFTYFENQGSRTTPIFDSDQNKLPNSKCVGKAIVDMNYAAYSSPIVLDFNGKYTLFTGNELGNIQIFNSIENNIYNEFTKIEKDYGNLKEGNSVHLSIADIDGDGVLDMAIGNARGGINIVSTDYRSDGTQLNSKDLDQNINFIFPNPVSDNFYISSKYNTEVQLSICALSGEEIYNGKFFTNVLNKLDVQNSGLYIFKLRTDNKVSIHKIFIQNH